MARRRDQEDVFKPLNDSPTPPTEEPQRSGRGREIKFGLLALMLAAIATGYGVYTQLGPDDDDADQVATGPSRLEIEGDTGAVPSEVMPAQFNDVSDSKAPTEPGAWASVESAVDQVPESLQAVPSQSYAEDYSPESQTQPLPHTTFAPMGSSNSLTTETAAPLPSETSLASPGSVQETDPPTAMVADIAPSYSPVQADPARSIASQYTPDSTNLPPAPAYDLRTTAKPDYAPGSQVPATELPAAPAYATPNESYAPAYTSPDQTGYAAQRTEVSPYSAGQTTEAPPYTGQTAATPSYAGPTATTRLTQDTDQSYPSSIPTRTQAEYTGLYGNSVTEQKASVERWQQPSVVPVDGKYTAQPNDNFYTISKKVYGSGAYFEALSRYNKDKYPEANQIRIGDVVQAPAVETLEGRYPELCPKPEHRDAAKRRSAAGSSRSLAGRRVYIVQEGDNLFDIARFELGARAKVADLIELNRDVLGDHINYLTPGMSLLLPETDGRGPKVTQRPTDPLR